MRFFSRFRFKLPKPVLLTPVKQKQGGFKNVFLTPWGFGLHFTFERVWVVSACCYSTVWPGRRSFCHRCGRELPQFNNLHFSLYYDCLHVELPELIDLTSELSPFEAVLKARELEEEITAIAAVLKKRDRWREPPAHSLSSSTDVVVIPGAAGAGKTS